MEPCSILDMPAVYDIASEYLGESDWLHMRVRNDLLDIKNPLGHKWFTNGTSVVLYEPVGNTKCQIHTLGVSRDKGLYKLCIDSSRWMLDNTSIIDYLVFVPKDRLDIKMFLKRLNAHKVGILRDELIYVITEGDLKCQ